MRSKNKDIVVDIVVVGTILLIVVVVVLSVVTTNIRTSYDDRTCLENHKEPTQ